MRVAEDPVLISSRREALIVFASWLIAMIWSVSYCYLNGYVGDASKISDNSQVEVRESGGQRELWIDRGKGPEKMTFVFGFPSWIFWGVALPWWLCTAFSIFFGAFIVRDEDLGQDIDAVSDAAGEGVAHA